jgi:hypothetical protein
VGRLIPKENELITIRDLFTVGLIPKAADGVKLLQGVRVSLPLFISSVFSFGML